LPSKLYIECDSLIGRNELDIAYQKFFAIAEKDSSSDVSLNLRRNLSAALQNKAAFILTPMLEDVRIFNSNKEQIKKAKTDLQKAATLLGENNFIYKNLEARILFLGSLYFQVNDVNSDVGKIIDSLELSSILEPNAPYTYYYLGLYYGKKREFEKSEKNLNKYLDLIPSSWWAYTNLGLLYFKTGNYDKAEKSFLKAIEISKLLYGPENPDYGKSLFNLGLLYMREDKYEKAKQLFNEAKDIREKVLGKHHMDYDALYMYYLGSIYLRSHDYVKAEALLNESKSIQRNAIDFPNYYSSLNAFESIYFSAGEYEKTVNLDREKREELKRAFLGDTTGSYTRDYSECVQFVVKGNSEKALDKLHLAFKNGYKDLANLQYDFNINDIRILPEFKILLEKYFKKDELARFPKIFVVK
jgi:tetratricopeptide (TPR) repeat protein